MRRFSLGWSMSSVKLNLILSLYFTVVLNIAFLSEAFSVYRTAGGGYFIYTMPLVLFAACNIVFNLLMLPALHKIIVPLLILISVAVSYYSLFFNIYFDRNMLTNILQTNGAESVRMISLYYLAWLFFLGVVPAVLYLRVKVSYKSPWRELLTRCGSVAVSAVMIIGVGALFFQDYASFFRNNKYITHLIVPSNFVNAAITKIKHDRLENMPFIETGKDAKMYKPDDYPHVTVLVVGETTRAQNWGLNGYARQTTPKLAARLAAGQHLINFTRVISCGTSTAVSVPCMFSSLNRADYNDAAVTHQDNLLDTLQHAGVDVHWIENNSDCKGVCARVPTVNTIELNLPEFCTDGECLDNIMLPEVDKIFSNIKRDTVLVLHTIGSHGPTYFERYTDKERRFSPTCDTKEINRCTRQEIVNSYDNGILYIDQFIDSVIGKLEAHTNWESALFYLSDHGESLGENGIYLHAAPYAIAPKEQTEVPMIMWFSDMWAKNEPFDLTCLRRNADNAYSQDNVFHTVFSLMDMDMKSLKEYDNKLDILSSCRKSVN